MGYEDTEDKLVSEFNEAKFQIFRLHNLWVECKHLRERGLLAQLRWRLDSACIELWNDAKRLDGDKNKEDGWVKKLTAVDEKINEAIKDKNLENFYLALIEKERLLRELQEESGKGGKFRYGDDDFM